mmetsp:Transcript_24220/g.36317  ORF Transcript_24220/g.36317 Transcript_24220/m.36317 type:complete len:349 (-) Transcript_24220:136-1182(-)|eukprot:CAMPEP_0167741210 /NCGR_PEP_ID=MMETSP0110_2-20121227/731_1 /TAXON_ID=629695 /ORGANISM="Gymnochlora sp., Strain CCMP2014" /LENGTH=348 /DNA_ID=CAMNT_0007625239 /DNA_START=62 /DNA_END=1108 /DNA_ORIENTATION=-
MGPVLGRKISRLDAFFIAACSRGDLTFARFALLRGADVNATGNLQLTALMHAAFRGHLRVVRFLVNEAGADICKRDSLRWTAMTWAVCGDSVHVLRYLIEEGKGSFLETTFRGHNLLTHAAINNSVDCMNYLLLYTQLSPNVRDRDGLTALHHAAACPDGLDVVKAMVEKGKAKVDIENQGVTPLMVAAHNGHVDVVKYFVEECKANASRRAKNGDNVLIFATKEGHIDVIKYLVEQANSDVKERGSFSFFGFRRKNATEWAVEKRQTKVVQYFRLHAENEDRKRREKESVKVLNRDMEVFQMLHKSILEAAFSKPDHQVECAKKLREIFRKPSGTSDFENILAEPTL